MGEWLYREGYWWPGPESMWRSLERAREIVGVEYNPVVDKETGRIKEERIKLSFDNGADVSLTQTPVYRSIVLGDSSRGDVYIVWANRSKEYRDARADVLNPAKSGWYPVYDKFSLNPEVVWQILGDLMQEAKGLIGRLNEGSASVEEIQTFVRGLKDKVDRMMGGALYLGSEQKGGTTAKWRISSVL